MKSIIDYLDNNNLATNESRGKVWITAKSSLNKKLYKYLKIFGFVVRHIFLSKTSENIFKLQTPVTLTFNPADFKQYSSLVYMSMHS